jgi:hypothetical protein
MIEYRIDYDAGVWLPVEEGDDWPDEVVAHYTRALGELPTALQDALRGFGVAAQNTRTPETEQLLAFCHPRLAPAVGVLAVRVIEAPDFADLTECVLEDSDALLVPNVEAVADEYWGEGVRAAIVTGSTSPETDAGRFNYAFQRDDSLLVATAVADRIPWASAMLPYADRLVASVRLETV